MQVTTAKPCKATTQRGAPCQTPASGSGWCFHHDPNRAAERAAARAKGGYARHGRAVGSVGAHHAPVSVKTVEDILSLLEDTINDVLALENSLNRARVLGTLALAALRVLEGHELEQRIAALEALLLERKGSP